MKQLRNGGHSKYLYSGILIVLSLTFRYGGSLLLSKSVDQQLSDEAYQMNQSLPRLVDEVTRLEHVDTFPGKRVRFTNTLIGVKDEDVLASKNDMIAMIRTSANKDEIKKNIQRGVQYTFVYKNVSGKTL